MDVAPYQLYSQDDEDIVVAKYVVESNLIFVGILSHDRLCYTLTLQQ